MKKKATKTGAMLLTIISLMTCMCMSAFAATTPATLKDGTYTEKTAYDASNMFVKLDVTVSGNVVTSATVGLFYNYSGAAIKAETVFGSSADMKTAYQATATELAEYNTQLQSGKDGYKVTQSSTPAAGHTAYSDLQGLWATLVSEAAVAAPAAVTTTAAATTTTTTTTNPTTGDTGVFLFVGLAAITLIGMGVIGKKKYANASL